jgi:NAD(P)-dependent dehydrogenase (short-subunit alcohol dehydrogenase family)
MGERETMDLRLTAAGPDCRRAASAGSRQTFVEAGALVVTCDVDQAALDRLRGELPQVPAIPADVADGTAVDRLFELALEQLGRIDILINNAGIAGPTGPIV